MHHETDWRAANPGMFTAALASPMGKKYLVVERVPGGGWDWIAWRADRTGRSLHGYAETPTAAMKAAERAVLFLSLMSL